MTTSLLNAALATFRAEVEAAGYDWIDPEEPDAQQCGFYSWDVREYDDDLWAQTRWIMLHSGGEVSTRDSSLPSEPTTEARLAAWRWLYDLPASTTAVPAVTGEPLVSEEPAVTLPRDTSSAAGLPDCSGDLTSQAAAEGVSNLEAFVAFAVDWLDAHNANGLRLAFERWCQDRGLPAPKPEDEPSHECPECGCILYGTAPDVFVPEEHCPDCMREHHRARLQENRR